MSEAKEKLEAEFDTEDGLGPTPMHLHEKRQYQKEFNRRYEGVDVVHVIPFSAVPYPEPGQVELTTEQVEALDKYKPGLSKTWTDPKF